MSPPPPKRPHPANESSPTTVTLTPKLHELLFLNPYTKVVGVLRSRYGNPTPVGVLGLCVAIISLAVSFMGWHGAVGLGIATCIVSIFFGSMLMILAGVGEFLLGNTFPMIVFFTYGAHFLSYGTTFVPSYNAIEYFKADGSGLGGPGHANQTPMFLASYSSYFVVLALLFFIFLLGSIRVNGVFVLIFALASIGFGLGAGTLFRLSHGQFFRGTKIATDMGPYFFMAGLLCLCFLVALMIVIMKLPIPDLPVFDLSTLVKARSRSRGMVMGE
ncbi:plasma membrane ammonium transporter [Clathrospora elynae]|uniref:Plasma membrane ammonium transporter n=1 Tax=Clathrospora elynae TaxID=706981 RepID=A0A6A5SJ08_9PLEO|nr:plasma membrane ammonium transporter [Clathrospora elynae]